MEKKQWKRWRMKKKTVNMENGENDCEDEKWRKS